VAPLNPDSSHERGSRECIEVSWTYALLSGSPFFAIVILVLVLEVLQLIEAKPNQTIAIAVFTSAGVAAGIFSRWVEQRRIAVEFSGFCSSIRVKYISGNIQSIPLASIETFKVRRSRWLGQGIWTIYLRFNENGTAKMMGLRLRGLSILMNEEDAHRANKWLSNSTSGI
jgi:hypothetical protein